MGKAGPLLGGPPFTPLSGSRHGPWMPTRVGRTTAIGTRALFGFGNSIGPDSPRTILEATPPPQRNLPARGRTRVEPGTDRKSTRLNSSHVAISYAVLRL